MTPRDAAHAHTIQRLVEALTVALRGRAIVRTQSPLALLDDSEPEPDIAVVPVTDYSFNHPAEAHLVVEIAGSSHRRDRLVKGAIYARFARVVRLEDHETLRLLRFPDVEVSIRDVLPTAK